CEDVRLPGADREARDAPAPPGRRRHLRTDRQVDVDGMPPMVACPYSPDNVRPLPDVAREHVKVDQVFLGSCTNAR
ncbi:hypothetical protein B1B_04143, partial [mine drainage metagenome]